MHRRCNRFPQRHLAHHVPAAHCAVEAGRSQRLAIRAESQVGDGAIVVWGAVQLRKLGSDIPQGYDAKTISGGEQVAVGAEGHPPHAQEGYAWRTAEKPAPRQIPEHHSIVVPRRRQDATVGADRHATHRTLMTAQDRLDVLGALQSPQQAVSGLRARRDPHRRQAEQQGAIDIRGRFRDRSADEQA